MRLYDERRKKGADDGALAGIDTGRSNSDIRYHFKPSG